MKKKKLRINVSKGSATPEEWANLWANATTLVSRAEIDNMAMDAMEIIDNFAKTYKPGIAYSGGKDSLVVQHLCQRVGHTLGVTGIWGELDYAFWREELLATVPEGIFVDWRNELSMDWLRKNDKFIFPTDIRTHHRLYALFHWKMLDEFYAERELGMWVMGRRTQDGNNCGRRGEFLVQSKKGNTLNPIRYWRHEHVFAYMQYHGIPLPHWYTKPYGFLYGPSVPIEENGTSGLEFATERDHLREGLRRVAQKEEAWVEPLETILRKAGRL